MFYPFVFYLLAMSHSPEFGKISLSSPFGYESYDSCTAELPAMNAELVGRHAPDSVHIILTGCYFNPGPNV